MSRKVLKVAFSEVGFLYEVDIDAVMALINADVRVWCENVIKNGFCPRKKLCFQKILNNINIFVAKFANAFKIV